MSFFVSYYGFDLKSIWSNKIMVTPAFLFMFAWNIIFYIFILCLCVPLDLEWVFYR